MQFRLTRAQWLGQFFRLHTPTVKVQREKKEKTKPIPWQVTLPSGQWIFVEAITKSEARGRAKRELKLSALPAGTRAIKVV